MERRIFLGIIFSLIIHSLFYVAVNIKKINEEPKKQVEIKIIKSQNKTKSKQVVQQDKKKINDETPDKDYYLGRHNQKVIRQTKAPKSGDFKNTSQSLAKSQGTKRKFSSKNLSVKDLTPKIDFKKLEKFKSVNASHDYLKKVKKGVQTALSTREFIYYSYYARIREQISLYWRDNVRESVTKIYRSGRYIASSGSRVTKIRITLDKNGDLQYIKVLGRSGVRSIDEAAVRAFKKASPFPNPPKSIIKRGKIAIRWDFILEA